MSKKSTPITPADASRIQSHADTTGRNQDFKARAQHAAAVNTLPATNPGVPPVAPAAAPAPAKALPQAPARTHHRGQTKG